MNKAYREELAIATFCRTYLHIHGFLSDTEDGNVHKRLIKHQDRNRIEISEAQLLSVDITYNDNAKDEDEQYHQEADKL